jgi:hypothetical protein
MSNINTNKWYYLAGTYNLETGTNWLQYALFLYSHKLAL